MKLELADKETRLSGSTVPPFKDWLASLIGKAFAALLKLLAMSWRSDSSQLARVDQAAANGTPIVAVFWHGSYLPLFALAAGRPVTVFTSQSFRGKIIVSICRAFGYSPQLLPSGRRGYHAMRAVLLAQSQRQAEPLIVAIAVDGPLGPAHKVKPGALYIAAKLGAAIVPIRVTSHPNWFITSRWDKFKIPLPLAKVRLFVGAPITIPAHLGRNHDEVCAAKRQVFDGLTGSDINRR